jgi:glycosyltransferase involved in cell wall biosynthesis
LEHIKGLEILLEAASRFEPARVHVHVGGTGDPEYENALKSQYGGPGVTFLGRVQPADFFVGLDALVVPSLVEDSLPRVVHEAFYYGVPVIGAEIGGIAEMIRQGETGYLVLSGDVAAMEQLILDLITSPPNWSALSAACLKEAEHYTFERVFASYKAAWTTAIERHESSN